MRRLLTGPFVAGVLGCLVLAGWALWSAGLLDGPIAREVRTSSVYAVPEVELDRSAAQRIIGNRRLVVVFLEPGADLRAACDRLRRAAAGTVVLPLSPSQDGYDRWGCSTIHDYDEPRDLGRALVAETTISRGVNEFPDQPLEALKVVVVNYDLLVKTRLIPDGARTVSPSLPRYLVAAAAILAVLIGSAVAYLGARRAGRLATALLARREAAADRRSELSAATAVLAHQLMELDQLMADRSGPAVRGYQNLAGDYVVLLGEVTAANPDAAELDRLVERVESLSERARELASTPPTPSPRR